MFDTDREPGDDSQKFLRDLKRRLKKADELRRDLFIEWQACDDAYQVVSKNYRGDGAMRTYDADEASSAFLDAELTSDGIGDKVEPASLKAAQACMFLHSKLIVSEPTVTITPFTNDQSDRKAAEFAKRFIKDFRKRSNLDEVLEGGVYLDVAVRGHGVCYIGWNPSLGELDTDGNPKGDFEVEHVAPHDFIIDTAATSFIKSNWCIRIRSVTLEEALYLFPDEKATILNFVRKKHERNTNDYRDLGKADFDFEAETVQIHEYWEKGLPWNKFEGKHFYFLYDERCDPLVLGGIHPHPYKHKKLPFVVLTDIDIADSPYGMSRVVQASVNFDALSTIYSIVMSNAIMHGQIHLLYPSGELPKELLRDATYRAIPYSPHSGAKPEHLKPTTVSGDFWTLHASIEREIDALYGMGESSQGQVKRELSSFTVQQAIEMDDKFRVRLFNKKKRAIEELYKQSLSLAQQFIGDSRAISAGGMELADEYLLFTGADLDGGYSVVVDYGMYIPADPAAKKQQVLELIKLGIMEQAGLDPKKLISLLVDGDMLSIKDLAEGAREVQEAENVKMSQGVPVDVEKFHEHEDHIFSISAYMNTQEFESLDQGVKQIFVEHAEKHKKALAEILAKSAPANQPQPGGKQPPK